MLQTKFIVCFAVTTSYFLDWYFKVNIYLCVKYIMMIPMAQTPHEDISNYLNDPLNDQCS